APVRAKPARTRRPRILPPHDAGRVCAQHAGGELPMAVLERDLRRQSPARRPVRVLLQSPTAGGVLRTRRRRGSTLARGWHAARDGQQLRDAAPHRDLRADPQQASRADAVPTQERPLPDSEERRHRMSAEELRAAIAAAVLGAEEGFAALLRSVVEVARAIFGARAATIFLLDEETDELVFEAIAGEGTELVGRRLPSHTGLAGFVLVSRQPLVLEEIQNDPRFASDVAESTGYMPQGLMAVPLLYDERALGVLEVLDRPQNSSFSLSELELLALFANQAAIALDLLQRARRARAVLDGEGELEVVSRLAAA